MGIGLKKKSILKLFCIRKVELLLRLWQLLKEKIVKNVVGSISCSLEKASKLFFCLKIAFRSELATSETFEMLKKRVSRGRRVEGFAGSSKKF